MRNNFKTIAILSITALSMLTTMGCTTDHDRENVIYRDRDFHRDRDDHRGWRDRRYGQADFAPAMNDSMATMKADVAPTMMDSMTKMEADMAAVPMTGNADRDFAAMMIPHHQGAIDMAKPYLMHGKDPALRHLAEQIIATQGQEIDLLRQRLAALPTTHPAGAEATTLIPVSSRRVSTAD